MIETATDNNGNLIYQAEEISRKIDPDNLPKPHFGMFIPGQSATQHAAELSNLMARYSYNCFNQMIRAETGTGVAEYRYNGEGLRTEKSVNGQIARYLYEYDKVLLEVDSQGKEVVRNVYGTNLISRTIYQSGQKAYYFYNGHGDVTALLNSAGNILASYYYDAFGNPIETTGSFDNSIRYAGYQYDTETGLYYLNARYYDSDTGRFLSEDIIKGDREDPLTLNLYTYVSNNPIKYKDPTGYWQQGDENLSYEARIEISRLTDLYYSARTQAEKDAIHAAAEAIRNNAVNMAATVQNSVTGQKTKADKTIDF